MKPILWIIAVIVLNAVIAAIAKKAQANAEAAKAGSAGGAGKSVRATTPAITRKGTTPPVVARGGASSGRGSSAGAKPPRVIARGGDSSKGARGAGTPARERFGTNGQRGSVRVTKSAPRSSPAIGDSSAALASRQHVADSIARIKQAEARIVGLRDVEVEAAHRIETPRPAFTAAELGKSLRDPASVRRAIVLGELLGRPRCDRAL